MHEILNLSGYDCYIEMMIPYIFSVFSLLFLSTLFLNLRAAKIKMYLNWLNMCHFQFVEISNTSYPNAGSTFFIFFSLTSFTTWMLNQKHKPPIVQSLLTYFFKLLQLLCSTLTFIWFRGIRTNWNLIIISTSTPPLNRLQCSRSPCNTSKPRQAGYRCLYFTNTVCEQLMNEAKTILSNLHNL